MSGKVPYHLPVERMLTHSSRGFAVIAPEKALEEVQVQTWATQHKMRVDEDEVMSTNE